MLRSCTIFPINRLNASSKEVHVRLYTCGCGSPHIRFHPRNKKNVRAYFAEGETNLQIWASFRRRRCFFGLFIFLCDMFDNFIRNFIVAFLFEGTKFKLETVFSVRG